MEIKCKHCGQNIEASIDFLMKEDKVCCMHCNKTTSLKEGEYKLTDKLIDWEGDDGLL